MATDAVQIIDFEFKFEVFLIIEGVKKHSVRVGNRI